jgi:hypothetical protein
VLAYFLLLGARGPEKATETLAKQVEKAKIMNVNAGESDNLGALSLKQRDNLNKGNEESESNG